MTRLSFFALTLIVLGSVLGGIVGCSGGDDALDKAAPPTTSTDKQPPAIPGKRPNRAPPLGGPNKGKDIFATTAGGGA